MRVLHTVPLIGQPTSGTCWAASIAMLLAWRGTPLDVFDVRTHTPIAADPRGLTVQQVAGDREGVGLSAHDTTAVLRWWGLVFPPGQTLTVEEFERLLRRRGPLFAISYTQGSLRAHCRVVTGLEGDGNPERTHVYINDPWRNGHVRTSDPGMPDPGPNPGSRYRESYSAFAGFQQRVVGDENVRLRGVANMIAPGRPHDRDWTETVRQNQIHAPEADCNYLAHWP